jgi:undecaprenyl diphosphate synthase
MTINHIAIIMDGNGRWATAQNLPKLEGHRQGAKTAKDIIKHAANRGVRHLTLYAFSFENWKRPETEVADILGILNFYLQNQINELDENNIRFKLIGDITKLSANMTNLVHNAEKLTQNNDLMTVYLAFSYGGRDEIIRACKRGIESGIKDITEQEFAKYLDVSDMPDVDLMIRSSGEKRISNFLIWQSAYSELYFSSKLWPDFTSQDLDEAIVDFETRKRNFGYAREQQV